MKVLKILGVTLLTILCLGILSYFGFFLMRTGFQPQAQLQTLSVEELFPAPEVLEEAEPEEEPVVEEM